MLTKARTQGLRDGVAAAQTAEYQYRRGLRQGKRIVDILVDDAVAPTVLELEAAVAASFETTKSE